MIFVNPKSLFGPSALGRLSVALCLVASSLWVSSLAGCGPSGYDSERPPNPFDPRGGNSGSAGGGQGGAGARDGGVVDADPFVIDFPDALVKTDAPSTGEEKKDALEACGGSVFQLARNPPEVMLVLDRSGSMRRTTEGGTPGRDGVPANATDRWTYTASAVNSVVMSTENDIRWGMKMYPSCMPGTQSGSIYPCAPNPCSIEGGYTSADLGRHASISGAIAGARPSLNFGATPTGHAVKDAVERLLATQSPADKFLLLATDGAPNCMSLPNPSNNPTWPAGDDGDPAQVQFAVAAVKAAKDAGIPVFVLGIAVSGATENDSVKRAHAALNQLAEAGGRARNDATTKYYPATNEAALKEALAEIAAATVSCTLPLTEPPPANAQARVDVDGTQVTEGATDGWVFGEGKKSIILGGELCAKLKRGELKKTIVSFGCPGQGPPPPPPIL